MLFVTEMTFPERVNQRLSESQATIVGTSTDSWNIYTTYAFGSRCSEHHFTFFKNCQSHLVATFDRHSAKSASIRSHHIMLAVFLCALAGAIFVPYQATNVLASTTIAEENLSSVVRDHPSLVLMAAKPRDAKLINIFIQMQPLYPEAMFATIKPESIRGFLNGTIPKTPFICVIKEGVPEVTFGPIFDDETVMSVTDLWLTKRRRPLQDQAALIGAMKGGPRTLAVPESGFERALEYAKETTLTHGPMNVVVMSQSLLKSLHVQNDDCCVYRRDDQMLLTLRHCKVSEYKASLRPAFSKSNRWTHLSSEVIVAFRTKSKNAAEINSIMGQLGDHFPQFQFVVAESQFAKRVAGVIEDPNWTETETNVAILNFTAGYYLDLGTSFPETMKTAGFDAVAWGNEIAVVLNKVRRDSFPRVYFSGKDENITNTTVYQRLSGRTFDKVMASDRDVLLLLVKPRSRDCSRVFRMFRSLGSDLDNQNNTDFYLALYDVVVNAIPQGNPAPKALCPTVLLYPANDRQNPKILPVESTDAMKWLISRYAKHSLNLTFSLPSQTDIEAAEKRIDIYNEKSPYLAGLLRQQLADLRQDVAKPTDEL